jgi:hypothetical protein
MKKIGLVGCAVATTLIGEVSDALAVGLVTVSGKSVEAAGGGTCAVGAGNGLDEGDHVIDTGGVEGYVGCDGVVGVVVLGEFVPQLERIAALASSNANEQKIVLLDL